MNKISELYMRIGTTFFKKVLVPLASGDFLSKLIKWNSESIKLDHGPGMLGKINKYDGFCVIPAHFENYSQVIGNFYNKYELLPIKPKPGSCDLLLEFIRHIFQEHYEYGLDYMQLLILQPVIKLPVLCLCSSERNTGKSTYLMLLKHIFAGNMAINTNEDFRSNFNSEWAPKSIVAVDETFLDKKEDSERIKTLSTSPVYKMESKGVDRVEIEFFAKFILCSNNEDSFINIDPQETRYWVRKVPEFRITSDKRKEQMFKEIPQFLHFLINRKLSTKSESRMWFKTSDIRTEALEKLIRNNRTRLELEIMNIIQYIMDSENVNEVKVCLKDVVDWLKYYNFRQFNFYSIKKIIHNNWGLKPANNTLSYVGYHFDNTGSLISDKRKGRYYTFTRDFIKTISE